MTHEKINYGKFYFQKWVDIKDGERLRIEIRTFYDYGKSEQIYEVSAFYSGFKSAPQDIYQNEIYQAKLEAWEKLKPSK